MIEGSDTSLTLSYKPLVDKSYLKIIHRFKKLNCGQAW